MPIPRAPFLLIALTACGGSSSETPWPVEPTTKVTEPRVQPLSTAKEPPPAPEGDVPAADAGAGAPDRNE